MLLERAEQDGVDADELPQGRRGHLGVGRPHLAGELRLG
jgi:hypothetical protein